MISPRAVGAGAFAVLGLALFAAVLFTIGERRMLFESRFTVYTEFASLGQLEPGAIVRVAGLNAGEVTDIQIPRSPAQKFRVEMEVREDLKPLIRTDSVASTQTEGLVGGVFINIAAGSENAPPVNDGGTIPSREPFALAELLQQASDAIALVSSTVERLSGDLNVAVEEIVVTTRDAQELIADVAPQIETIARNGSRISSDAQQIVAGLREGEGTVGKLLKDDSLYMRARDMVQEASSVMANVRQVSDDARQAIEGFRSQDGPAQGLVADMRLTLAQAREATADLADNMEALKHNFLLRGFFNRRGYFDLDAISPAEYRRGVLENDRRKAHRIWLSSATIFEPDATGARETLSESGRARLDSAMATFLPFLPSSPMVVEGYGTEGTAGERYRRARQRAGLVREYLLSRYDLMPQHTGFIALGDEAWGSPTGNQWDGVALTLFLDTKGVAFATQPRNAGTGTAAGGSTTQ